MSAGNVFVDATGVPVDLDDPQALRALAQQHWWPLIAAAESGGTDPAAIQAQIAFLDHLAAHLPEQDALRINDAYAQACEPLAAALADASRRHCERVEASVLRHRRRARVWMIVSIVLVVLAFGLKLWSRH